MKKLEKLKIDCSVVSSSFSLFASANPLIYDTMISTFIVEFISSSNYMCILILISIVSFAFLFLFSLL